MTDGFIVLGLGAIVLAAVFVARRSLFLLAAAALVVIARRRDLRFANRKAGFHTHDLATIGAVSTTCPKVLVAMRLRRILARWAS
jgi:ABC-type uncharacterized transport system permease subunit